ncbi:DmpA family aminopeptidase [Gordonia sp. NPDC003424]
MSRNRIRDLGVNLPGTPGPLNAITDVAGLEVGYATLNAGDGPLRSGEGPVRTGVTAILPRGRDGVGRPCSAGFHSLNGNGEMTGVHWIQEVGEVSLPITISNTHAVGPCHAGVVEWINEVDPTLGRQWLLPVCAETWDGYLNDINGGHVTTSVVRSALDAARPGPIAEGNVGGGTGMNCYGYKGGSGTSSRVVDFGAQSFTVGAFVQANFGSRHELSIAGSPAGAVADVPCPIEQDDWLDRELAVPGGAGSVIIIVATDAPASPKQCEAIARRVPMGLARTGTTGSLFSGDLFLALSTADDRPSTTGFPTAGTSDLETVTRTEMPWNRMDEVYAAAVYAVEEAVLNALAAAEDMIGRDGHRSFALPHDVIRAAVR